MTDYLGLVAWMNFDDITTVLLVEKAKIYENFFAEKKCKVCCASTEEICTDVFQKKYFGSFDYAIGLKIIEEVKPYDSLLSDLKKILKQKGKLLLGADNRIGLRYLCGEQDPYTQRCFDGLDNYITYLAKENNAELKKRCYTKAELKKFLTKAGFNTKFYSVFPNLKNPQLIMSEDYNPKERISGRYTPTYRNPDTIFFREEQFCDDFVQNEAIHAVANAFWIECSLNDCFMDMKQVTLSLDRGKENAFATIIRTKDVEKKAVFKEGIFNLENLSKNMGKLQEHGILTVPGKQDGYAYIMPCESGMLGDVYLRELLKTDAGKFIKCMDHFRELIMKSSEHISENEDGIILKDGYVDMVPLNSFYKDGEFVFFDQEFCIPNYPANAIIYRTVVIVYERIPENEAKVSKESILERYGLKQKFLYWHKITTDFIDNLRRRKQLVTYYNMHVRNDWIMNYNKKRLDDMVNKVDFYEEYRRDTCFENLHNKKVILFGAGKWCDKFLAFYKDEYEISCILDNDENKWGTKMYGIPIVSPEDLPPDRDTYKVIICIKDYRPIFRQLKRMEVLHIGIYDANYFYPGRQTLNIISTGDESKKYRIGYLSGTFDMFHIGHVNMLRRAKEQCEYLIVAVTSDEYVRTHKNKEPVIPFDERVEVLRACKYVDEVVGVPFNYAGTVEAFQKYHFDCQFCGSDCENDAWWLDQKEFLQAHGSDLVFFPYTEQTSSTKIRALIDKELLS